jgi:predicted nucleic-acid-binding protein
MQNTERLETALAGAQQQQEQVQASIEQAIESLKPQIELMVTVSIMAVVVYILLKVLDSLHKRRIEKAIMRMDKNLELLVADKKPVQTDEKV